MIVRSLPLSHSQNAYWQAYTQSPIYSSNFSNYVGVPSPCSLESIAAACSALVNRHEALRTTFGLDESGRSTQWVHEPVDRVVDVYDVDVDVDDPAVLASLLADARAQHIDIEQDWPIRFAAIRAGGILRYLVYTVHPSIGTHRVMMLIKGDLLECLSIICEGASPELQHEGIRQPSDHYLREISPSGADASSRGLRYRIAVLETAPALSFPYRRPTGVAGRLHHIGMRSLALSVALDKSSKALRVPASAVLFGAFNVMLGTYTRQPLVWDVLMDKGALEGSDVTYQLTHNLIVSNLSEATTVGEVIRTGFHSMLVAMRNSDHDNNAMLEARPSVYAQRGTRIAAEASYNFVVDPLPVSNEYALADPVDLLDKTRIMPADLGPGNGYVSVQIGSMADSVSAVPSAGAADGAAYDVSLAADTTLVSADNIGRVLFGVEQLVCRLAAGEDVSMAEVIQRMNEFSWPRRPNLTPVPGARWLDSEATREIIAAHPAVVSARITLQGATDLTPERIQVFVTTRRSDLGEAELIRHCLAHLDRPGVVAPDDVFITVLPGARVPAEAPQSQGALALADAFEKVHGFPAVDLSGDYVAQGGRAERVPALRKCLDRAGWTGLLYEELFSPKPLTLVGNRLERTPVLSGSVPG